MQTTSSDSEVVNIETHSSSNGYRTAPDHENSGWPPGIPFIVGNEACERFSFYGMKSLLQPHLTALYVATGFALDKAEGYASSTQHFFIAGIYALPMIGAIIADRFAGKYRTILYLSLVYCLGHGVLAVADNTLGGMYLGLALIAVGSGGIKPCVSANVGDQFGKSNMFRLQTVYQIFYFSINFGAFFSTILSPLTMKWWGPKWAFGIPGILMLIATIFFWMGRKKFIHVQPNPGGKIGLLDTLSSTLMFLTVGSLFFTGEFDLWVKLLVSAMCLSLGLAMFAWRQRLQPDDGFLTITLYAIRCLFSGSQAKQESASFERKKVGVGENADPPALAGKWFWGPAVERFGPEATEGPVAVFKIISVFFLVSVFWALFDQQATTWIIQANQMDLSLHGLNETFSFLPDKIMSNQIQAVNPLLVMLLIPLLNPWFAFLNGKGFPLTPLRKISIGMFLASLGFASVALLQVWIEERGEGQVWFVWQFIPFLVMTLAEVLVSITGLEFAYTQAPKRMKSTVMGFWLLTVALGNVLAGLLTGFSNIPLMQLFWLFSGLMAGAALLFGIRSYFYVQKNFT